MSNTKQFRYTQESLLRVECVARMFASRDLNLLFYVIDKKGINSKEARQRIVELGDIQRSMQNALNALECDYGEIYEQEEGATT